MYETELQFLEDLQIFSRNNSYGTDSDKRKKCEVYRKCQCPCDYLGLKVFVQILLFGGKIG